MSKSSTASTSKIPAQLPQRSAWSKGPPQTSASSAAASTSASPRSQSPAPPQNATQSPVTQTHSRRPSALGQGVSIKEGVSIPRSNVGAANVKQGKRTEIYFFSGSAPGLHHSVHSRCQSHTLSVLSTSSNLDSHAKTGKLFFSPCIP
jgi:hypothetical protein